jgi:hypothetical protein
LILFQLIAYALKGAKNTNDIWHFAVGTVLFPLWNLDITGLSVNAIVQMDSTDNVILVRQTGSGIIQLILELLKSHKAYARCAKFRKVHWSGIPLLDHSITHETRRSTRVLETKLLSMICSLLVFIQS